MLGRNVKVLLRIRQASGALSMFWLIMKAMAAFSDLYLDVWSTQERPTPVRPHMPCMLSTQLPWCTAC